MQELPLFPLGTVLFPGMTINLHIFEERYKEMINLCLESRQPFGVVLIKEGREAFGPATPYMIGCTARIARMQPMGEGRMEIIALGQERFTIQSLRHDRPYLVGMVDVQPVQIHDPHIVNGIMRLLRPRVLRYLDILSQVGDVQFQVSGLPDNPVEFAYLATAILQHVSETKKQQVLAATKAIHLLEQVNLLYQIEITLLENMLERADSGEAGTIFSLN